MVEHLAHGNPGRHGGQGPRVSEVGHATGFPRLQPVAESICVAFSPVPQCHFPLHPHVGTCPCRGLGVVLDRIREQRTANMERTESGKRAAVISTVVGAGTPTVACRNLIPIHPTCFPHTPRMLQTVTRRPCPLPLPFPPPRSSSQHLAAQPCLARVCPYLYTLLDREQNNS